jgi:hypothetical protein
VADAPRLRDLFLARMKTARGAGLGDERADESHPSAAAGGWTPQHLGALRAVLEEARMLRAAV